MKHLYYYVFQPVTGAKNCNNLVTLDFDHEYLRDGSRYKHGENGVINCYLSYVRRQNLVDFGPPTTKFRWLMFTVRSV